MVVRLRREGKTYREIAEEVRISVTQIEAIMDNATSLPHGLKG